MYLARLFKIFGFLRCFLEFQEASGKPMKIKSQMNLYDSISSSPIVIKIVAKTFREVVSLKKDLVPSDKCLPE